MLKSGMCLLTLALGVRVVSIYSLLSLYEDHLEQNFNHDYVVNDYVYLTNIRVGFLTNDH